MGKEELLREVFPWKTGSDFLPRLGRHLVGRASYVKTQRPERTGYF